MKKTLKNKIILEIKKAAQKKGVDFEFIYRTYYYLMKADKKILFTESMPETTSAISYRLTENKFLMNVFLKRWRFPVQVMERYSSIEQAISFLKKYKKIVVKPERGMHGKGITVGLTNEKDLPLAIAFAQKNDVYQKVILEEFNQGDDYRVLVIGKKKVFVSKKEPVFVVGNGKDKIIDLLQKRNKNLIKRYQAERDDIMEKCLQEQCLSFSDVLENGQKIYLKKTANIKSGGTPTDYTDKISPKIKSVVIEIANKLEMDVAGFDIMTEDISSEDFEIIEINAYPGLLLHIYPVKGKSYNVADEIVKYFFFSNKF